MTRYKFDELGESDKFQIAFQVDKVVQNMYGFMHLSSQTNLLLEAISGEECLLSRMMKPGTPARPGRPAQTRGPRRTGTHQDSIETKDCSRTCICGRGLGSGKLWRAEN